MGNLKPNFFHFFWVGFLFLGIPSLKAQTPLNPPMTTSPIIGQVGVAAAVRGDVQLIRGGGIGLLIESGEPIYVGDTIKTDTEGSLQILLVDETVFTIGPSSAMLIENFSFDAKSNDGDVTARVVNGAFKMITGKVGQKDPRNVKVNLPTGVMAVRGTIVYLTVNGQSATGILGGPGPHGNTDHRVGSFELKNEVGSGDGDSNTASTFVFKPGTASTIPGPGLAPSPAFEFPVAEFIQLQNSFTTRRGKANAKGDSDSGSNVSDGGESDGEQSASDQAGQSTAQAFGNLLGIQALSSLTGEADETTGDAAEDGANSSQGIQDGLSRISDLLTIDSGIYHYAESDVPIYYSNVATGGTYDIAFDIDFGARSIGGDASHFSGSESLIDGGDLFDFSIPEVFFDEFNGDAEFAFFDLPDSGGSIMTAKGDLYLALFNEGGEPGAFAAHGMHIEEVGPDEVDGSGIAERFNGPSV